jgi:hypothetical protein
MAVSYHEWGEWDEFQEISFHHLPDSFKKWDADERGKRGKEHFWPYFYMKSAFIRIFTCTCGRCKGPRPFPKMSGDKLTFNLTVLLNGTRTSADVCPAGGKRGKEYFLDLQSTA